MRRNMKNVATIALVFSDNDGSNQTTRF